MDNPALKAQPRENDNFVINRKRNLILMITYIPSIKIEYDIIFYLLLYPIIYSANQTWRVYWLVQVHGIYTLTSLIKSLKFYFLHRLIKKIKRKVKAWGRLFLMGQTSHGLAQTMQPKISGLALGWAHLRYLHKICRLSGPVQPKFN